jgi:hypothetical protein
MTKSVGLLFIGNSFTARNDVPALLAEMAALAPKPITVTTDSVLANGASLRQHWNAGTAVEKMREGRWDYVVLQEQSTLPIKNATRYSENVRLFVPEIEACGAQPRLYLTWARIHSPETQAALTDATRTVATEIGARVVPVGVAWQELREAHPELGLYDKDGSHPSALGSYLAACVFYATLFGASPVGLEAPGRLKLDAAHVALVQNAAAQTLSENSP